LPSSPRSLPFPYTTLFRSQPVPERGLLLGHHPQGHRHSDQHVHSDLRHVAHCWLDFPLEGNDCLRPEDWPSASALHWLCQTRSRSEEHTSELQSRENLVCR